MVRTTMDDDKKGGGILLPPINLNKLDTHASTLIVVGDPPAPPVGEDSISLADFQPGATPKLTLVPKPTCWCSVQLDVRTRVVTCVKCGRVFEVFEALLHIATFWRRFAQNRDAVRNETTRLREEKEALTREIKNLRAMKQRLEDAVEKLSGGRLVGDRRYRRKKKSIP
jgi:hypothetical protein